MEGPYEIPWEITTSFEPKKGEDRKEGRERENETDTIVVEEEKKGILLLQQRKKERCFFLNCFICKERKKAIKNKNWGKGFGKCICVYICIVWFKSSTEES